MRREEALGRRVRKKKEDLVIPATPKAIAEGFDALIPDIALPGEIENPIFKEVRPELDPPKYADDVYKEETRILECVLQTDEYLGYLRGSEILAKLDGRYILAGFYAGKRTKFIEENTP